MSTRAEVVVGRGRGMAAVLVMVVPALAIGGGAASAAVPARELSCAPTVTFMGVDYPAAMGLSAGALGGSAGPGVLPGCDDVGGQPPEPPTTIPLRRIEGVAPRFAVAFEPSQGRTTMLLAASSGCGVAGRVAPVLRCLRERTRRFALGPSLITYPSAVAGEIIRVSVHIRDPKRRRSVFYGIDAVLLRWEDGTWRPVFHLEYAPSADDHRGLPRAVPFGEPYSRLDVGLTGGMPRRLLIPEVTPGRYRIAKSVTAGGGRPRWLVADLTVLPRPACASAPTPCVHG